MIMWSARLSGVRRFNGQPYWHDESAASDKAVELENQLPLENVAEHSWKVADMAMFLYYRVPHLDRSYCIELALLHDKLELITGDDSPIDDDATGRSTHAFNEDRANDKKWRERAALVKYLQLLPEPTREYQRRILEDTIEIRSEEARFVNALDKLAALAYVIAKKVNGLRSEHYKFTRDYSRKAVLACPALLPHHELMVSLLKCAYQTD
jgi:5'-deoxynucleotidase YfbR-like HD superfamily hydrolase